MIREIRGVRVILDSDLAKLYGVPTFRFNEAIKRNRYRFPPDFMFQLNQAEFETLKSQTAVSKMKRKPNSSQIAMSSRSHLSFPALPVGYRASQLENELLQRRCPETGSVPRGATKLRKHVRSRTGKFGNEGR